VGQTHLDLGSNPLERGLWGIGLFYAPSFGNPLKRGLARSGLHPFVFDPSFTPFVIGLRELHPLF